MKEDIPFDSQSITDPEFKSMQIMVGRSMMNIMIYIQQNYLSHFKDIKVDSIANETLRL